MFGTQTCRGVSCSTEAVVLGLGCFSASFGSSPVPLLPLVVSKGNKELIVSRASSRREAEQQRCASSSRSLSPCKDSAELVLISPVPVHICRVGPSERLLLIPAPCWWGSVCASMSSAGMWMGSGCGVHVLHGDEPSRWVVSMCLDRQSLLGVCSSWGVAGFGVCPITASPDQEETVARVGLGH